MGRRECIGFSLGCGFGGFVQASHWCLCKLWFPENRLTELCTLVDQPFPTSASTGRANCASEQGTAPPVDLLIRAIRQ